MAREFSAEPAQVYYLYAIAEGLPRRWRPPADGVGAAPVVARAVRDLTLIMSAVDTIPLRTPKARARHDEVASAALGAEAVLPLPFGTVVPALEVDDWLVGHLSTRTCRGCAVVWR